MNICLDRRVHFRCVATGSTTEEVEKKMKEAIEFHLEGLELEKLAKPTPHTYSSYIEAG